MDDFEYFVEKVEKFHGHVCAGIALGTKITLAAMDALGFSPHQEHKDLIVYTEIDRCMTDALQAITGCSLGHRSLKYVNYGKFAATFVNITTGKAVRATVKEHFKSEGQKGEILKAISQIPDDKLVTLQEVEVDIPECDLPGPSVDRAICSVCGERVMDGRAIQRGSTALCKACAGEAYYRLIIHNKKGG